MQVLRCIEERLKSDTDLIVRRAAAIFPFRLLQGLGKDTFKVCYVTQFTQIQKKILHPLWNSTVDLSFYTAGDKSITDYL